MEYTHSKEKSMSGLAVLEKKKSRRAALVACCVVPCRDYGKGHDISRAVQANHNTLGQLTDQSTFHLSE